MTEKERFIKALKREPLEGHVPTFELVFYLTMEVLGKVHPLHRDYSQWNQMSVKERELHLQDMASCFIDIAEKIPPQRHLRASQPRRAGKYPPPA